MRHLVLLLLSAVLMPAAEPPIYHLLWFDTEDYIEPASDDAALRVARELSARGVRATFKVVGEKARVLEQRGRNDVIAALRQHDIGYHTNFHSVHPAPAEYLNLMGMLDGAAEFSRREERGLADVARIFGMKPSAYGQPGNSWAPQANMALRKWGVKVYMDDGGQVGYERQPFWFGGVLYVFNLGPNTVRAELNDPSAVAPAIQKFDTAVAGLRKTGGVIQTYYHPCEFSTVEFWDGVNFSHGANPPREEWKKPRKRTPESAEQAYKNMLAFVDHIRQTTGVRMVTARELPALFQDPVSAPPLDLARKLQESIDIRDGYSAADQLLRLLNHPPQYVDGPLHKVETSWTEPRISRAVFERAKEDVWALIHDNSRLPDAAWLGSHCLSLADFAATLAADSGSGPSVEVKKGKLEIEKYIGTDAARNYNWVIHPQGFAPQHLLDLARLQAWTLKPAQLRLIPPARSGN